MSSHNLSSRDVGLIVFALQGAATHYLLYDVPAMVKAGQHEAALRFRKQACELRELADRLDEESPLQDP